MNQEKLGKFLVGLRKEKGFTQKEVATKIGVTEQAISKWERELGIPDMSLWDSICETFDISLMELLNAEKNQETDKEEVKKINGLLKNTINLSNDKISKMEFKVILLLIGLAISIYVVSLVLNLSILNYFLFGLASVIVIYFLGIILKKWSYTKKFLIISLVLTVVVLSYSYLEKVSIIQNYREPIFSIKEIYKEYNLTLYNSIFYDAYSCDYSNNEITIFTKNSLKTICPEKNYTNDNTTEIMTLKSGVTVTYEQVKVLDKFQDELLKFGYVDYNYMREEDLQNFWNYIDETHYCNNYNSDNSNSLVKRKNGICQYDNDEFYYCIVTQNDGTVKYEKAINRSCN